MREIHTESMKEGDGEAMILGERGRRESTILESIHVVIGILVIGSEAEPLLNQTEDGQEGGKARIERKNQLSGCTSITAILVMKKEHGQRW